MLGDSPKMIQVMPTGKTTMDQAAIKAFRVSKDGMYGALAMNQDI